MNKGLIINEDIWPMIDELEQDEKADLLTALSAYYQGDEIPDMDRIVKMVFNQISLGNARFDPEKRAELSAKRAEAGRIGGSKQKQNKQTKANEANGSKISNSAQDKKREDKKREDIEKIREDEKRELSLQKKAYLPPELDYDNVRMALKDFRDMRTKIKKPITPRAEQMIINELMKLSGGDPIIAEKILDQSIMNSWQGVFPLKEKPEKKPYEPKDDRKINYDQAARDIFLKEVCGL